MATARANGSLVDKNLMLVTHHMNLRAPLLLDQLWDIDSVIAALYYCSDLGE